MKYFMLVLLFVCSSVVADCSNMYLDKQPPIIKEKTKPLCYTKYEAAFSPENKTSLYAAQRLVSIDIDLSERIARHDRFHQETLLPESERVATTDYRNSGYDRGHLAPAGDMPDLVSQYESFSMANMIPQRPNNNRVAWRMIEDTVHDKAMMLSATNSIYVITGVIYNDNVWLKDIRVPNIIYKAVYSTDGKMAGVFIAENNDTRTYTTISIKQFEETYGIIVFPSLSNEARNMIKLTR